MPGTSPFFIGLVPGILVPQEGNGMKTTQWGFDEGSYKYLTHPQTQTSSYPQRSQRHPQFSSVYVTDVVPRQVEGTLIELDVQYKGLLTTSGTNGQNKLRLLPSTDTSAFTIAALSSGKSISLVAPIPNDVVVQEYVTTTKPTRQGVGNIAIPADYNTPAGFTITFVADPDGTPPPINYYTGWVLEDRSSEDIAGAVWLVRERYRYYYNIAV